MCNYLVNQTWNASLNLDIMRWILWNTASLFTFNKRGEMRRLGSFSTGGWLHIISHGVLRNAAKSAAGTITAGEPGKWGQDVTLISNRSSVAHPSSTQDLPEITNKSQSIAAKKKKGKFFREKVAVWLAGGGAIEYICEALRSPPISRAKIRGKALTRVSPSSSGESTDMEHVTGVAVVDCDTWDPMMMLWESS